MSNDFTLHPNEEARLLHGEKLNHVQPQQERKQQHNNGDANGEDAEIEYGPTARRWPVLILCMWLCFCCQLQYGLFITIVPQMSLVFSVEPSTVDLLTAIFPFTFALATFPGLFFLKLFGLQKGLITGGGMLFFGALLKVLAVSVLNRAFWAVAIGSVFAGASQVFILGTPPMIASVWFPDNERTLATSLATCPGFLGFGIAILTSTHLTQAGCVDESQGITAKMCAQKNYNSGASTELISQVEKGLMTTFLVQAAVTMIPAIGMMLVVKKRPKMPSRTAEGFEDEATEEYKESRSFKNYLATWKSLFGDSALILVVVVMGINNGFLTGLASLLTSVLSPFGMTEDQVGALGLAAVGTGAFAASLVPALLCKRFGPGYKTPWKILHVGQTISFSMLLVLVLIVTATNNDDTTTAPTWFVPCVFVVYTCVEVFLLPIFPTTMELAAETIYPKPAAIGGSMVIGAVCVSNTIFTALISRYIGGLEPHVSSLDHQDKPDLGSGSAVGFPTPQPTAAPTINIPAQEGTRNVLIMMLLVQVLLFLVLHKYVKERLNRVELVVGSAAVGPQGSHSEVLD